MPFIGLAANAPRSLAAWFLAVVVGSFALYNANFRELGLADTIPSTLLPASVLRDFDLDLDEFEPLLSETAPGGLATLRQQVDWTLAIRQEHGHLVSSYPVGGALLAVPIYAVPVLLGTLRHFKDYRVAGKVSASLYVSLSAGLLFLSLLRFTGRAAALFLTAVYALGTSCWVIASQAMWQHGPALACLSLAVWAALRLQERNERGMALLVSAASAMAVVCRPQDVFGALAVGLFALMQQKPRFRELILPACVIGALLVSYNVRTFGTVSGGYDALYQAPAHAFRHVTRETVFTLPLVEGLAGLLVSPGKGLVFYSPVLVAALVLLPVLALPGGHPLGRYLVGWVVLTLYFLAKNRLWWGGTSYGPRYLTELALPLVLTLAMLFHRILRSRVALSLLVASSCFGVAVQALGAVTWECGWHHSPAWLDFRLDRIWDYRDPEIARCAQRFLTSGPALPEFGPFARPRKRTW